MKVLYKSIWTITPEMLQTMMTITRQNKKSPEAVASQLGKEMSDAPNLKIGEKIDTDDETFTVHSEPVKDIYKLVWSCDLMCT